MSDRREHEPEEAAPESVTVATGGLSWTRGRVPRILSTVAKVFYAMGGIGVGLASLLGATGAWMALLYFTGLLAYPLWILSYILSLTQTTFSGALEIMPTYVAVRSGKSLRLIPRSHIEGALVVDRPVGTGVMPSVELEIAGGDRLTARFADPSAAQAVVEKLGFGRQGRRVKVRLSKPTWRFLHLVLAVFAYFSGLALAGVVSAFSGDGGHAATSVLMAVYPLTSLLVYELLRRRARPPEVTVGNDAVRIVKGFGAFSAHLRTDLASYLTSTALDSDRLAAVQRLMARRASPPESAPFTPERLAAYGREGLPVGEWRTRLAQAIEPTHYRVAALTPDDAAHVLKSHEATPEQRVGAALALRVAGEAPEKIRASAETIADERLRAALEAVAEDDDAGAEKALRKLSRQ